jgi:beta-1,4-N-acetylglucosaminyltransferase
MFGTLLLLSLLGSLSLAAILLRARFILSPTRSKPIRHGRRNPREPTHLLIVLGSGGHTAEMLSMLDRAVNEPNPAARLEWRDYTHRTWVVNEGDSISASRARDFEESTMGFGQERLMEGKVKKATDLGPGTYEVVTVPRARMIHQSLYSAPISCAKTFAACWNLLVKQVDEGKGRDFPDLVMVNGPATATILVYTAIALRFFNVRGCVTNGKLRTVYVESWARVKKMSLSGNMLSRVVDKCLVQWPQLDARRNGSGKAKYVGMLV